VRGTLRAKSAIAWALTGLVLFHGRSTAQERKQPGHYRLGPIHVTPRLQIKDAGVDTNVFQTLERPTRDEVVVFGPRVESVMALRRLRVTSLAFVEVNYFHREGEERFIDFYGDARAELDAGPLTFFAFGGGGQFHNRFSIDVDERLKRQEKRSYAGLTCRLGRRGSATVQGGNEVLTFAPSTFRLGGFVKEAMDRNSLVGTAQLRYAVTRKTTLVLSADALEDRFFSQPLDSPRVRQSYRYLAGVELGPRALVSGKLLLGMRQFPGTLAHGSPPYEGPVILADLTIPLRVARLRVQGDRDVQYAGSLVAVGLLRYRNAFVYDRYRGEASFGLPLGLVGVLSAGFEKARYLLPYPYPDAFHLQDRVDHRWMAGGGLARQFGDQVRVGAHVQWARRVSSLALFSYEGVRYGLSAEIIP
jgi:hypothetical protein